MSNITIVGVLVVLILLFAIANNGYAQTTIPTVEKAVELKSHKIKCNKFSIRLIGQVQNNVGDVEFVKIVVTFYDQNGGILGTNFSYTDNRSKIKYESTI